LNGQAHSKEEIGLENFTIMMPDKSSVNTLALNILNSTTGAKKINENQLLVCDPDAVEFLVRSYLTIARSSKYNYTDHGMEWNNSDKNSLYYRFKYNQ
jgi:hypothetical protein